MPTNSPSIAVPKMNGHRHILDHAEALSERGAPCRTVPNACRYLQASAAGSVRNSGKNIVVLKSQTIVKISLSEQRNHQTFLYSNSNQLRPIG